MAFQISRENIDALFQQRQAFSTPSDYIKWKPGVYRIRFCGAWSEEGIPTRMLIQHGNMNQPFKDAQGNMRQPLCNKYVFTQTSPTNGFYIAKAIANELIKRGTMTAEQFKAEFDRYQQFGCLGCRLHDILNSSGNKIQLTRSTYLWNIIKRDEISQETPAGKVYKWSTSSEQFKNIINFYNIYNKLFDVNEGFDFNLSATGEGKQRRYTLTPIPTPCPQGNVPLFNLDEAMTDGFRTTAEYIELINNTFPQALPILGINPAMFDTDKPPF